MHKFAASIETVGIPVPPKTFKLLVALAIAAGIAAFFALGLGRYFTLEYFEAQRAAIEELASAQAISQIAPSVSAGDGVRAKPSPRLRLGL